MPRGKPPPRAVALVGKLFWTVGGLGLVPLIPGTVGTLAGVGLVYLATRYPGTDKILLGLACFFTIAGVPLANLAERVHGKDPQSFVWDEVAGYLVTMLAMPIQREPVLCVVGGFFAFRFFDILKPWPIRSIEQKPGGISVIADDIVAGLYANAALHAVLLFR
jgi:phosphatidylglycerophosphatase A